MRVLSIAAALLLATTVVSGQFRLEPLDASTPISYFIAAGMDGSSYRDSDNELARWALDAWARAAGGALTFTPGTERNARIRVNWVPAGGGQYGEMMPFAVDGQRGAQVFIRPDTDGLGPDIARLSRQDPLLRDTIVYLTCLHELGHALGLPHTSDYRDIMYAFGHGGDIPRYFGRYRDQLMSRGDIAKVSGLSAGDEQALRALYPR